MSGLTELGFERKLFSEIKAEQENALTRSLGELNFNAPSVIAQIVSIFAEREASLWELLEAVYNSGYPDTAEGQSLDGVCALTGMTRLDATNTTVLCQLEADNLTTIQKGAKVKVKDTDNIFILEEKVIITDKNCYSIALKVEGNDLPVYGLNINETLYEYEKREGDLAKDIANALIYKINESDIGLIAVAQEENITITSKLERQTFSCSLYKGIGILSCTNNASFTALEAGEVAAPRASVSCIHTPLQGWLSVSNLTAGKLGRNLETDTQLRRRRAQSLALSCSGTFEAMLTRLRNIPGVTAVNIRENATDIADENNIPAHSFEAMVAGGENEQIGQVIWAAKPIGISSHGNTDVYLKDSANQEQLIKFSRPEIVYIFASIKFDKNNQILPDEDAEAAIIQMKKSIVTQINSAALGATIAYQPLFRQVYSLDGIDNATITIGRSSEENSVPAKTANNINLGISEQAVTDIDKIEVVCSNI